MKIKEAARVQITPCFLFCVVLFFGTPTTHVVSWAAQSAIRGNPSKRCFDSFSLRWTEGFFAIAWKTNEIKQKQRFTLSIRSELVMTITGQGSVSIDRRQRGCQWGCCVWIVVCVLDRMSVLLLIWSHSSVNCNISWKMWRVRFNSFRLTVKFDIRSVRLRLTMKRPTQVHRRWHSKDH